jgi:hypothetical protein
MQCFGDQISSYGYLSMKSMDFDENGESQRPEGYKPSGTTG